MASVPVRPCCTVTASTAVHCRVCGEGGGGGRAVPICSHHSAGTYPPCPNTGQVLVQRAKVRKHGVAMFGQPRVTRRPHVVHDYKRVFNRPAYTAEYTCIWNYTYTNTSTPMLTLPAACTKLQTTFSIGLKPQKKTFQKKAQKCGNTGSPCLDKPMLGRGGGDCLLRPHTS